LVHLPPCIVANHLSSGPSAPRETPTITATANPAAPSITPTSKWQQIRAANSRTSTNSSWDAIRQSHERKRIDDPSSDHHGAGLTRYEDRSAEQAKFEALLEKERNIK